MFHFQNEEEQNDEKESKKFANVNNSKFSSTEVINDRTNAIDQNNQVVDLPCLSSNHIITSPNNSNAVWNTDSWADGEFEPLEETNSGNV